MGPKFGPKLGFLAQIQVQRPVRPTLSLSINPNPRLTPSVLHILSGLGHLLKSVHLLKCGGSPIPDAGGKPARKGYQKFSMGEEKAEIRMAGGGIYFKNH